MSNLKQIGLGIMMYAQDYDGAYPMSQRDTSSGGATYWFYDIEPYVKNFQVFECPSSTEGYYPDGDRTKYNHGYIKAGNYGANELVMPLAMAANISDLYTVKLASLVSASSTYMIMDSGNVYLEPYYVKNPGNGYFYLPGEGALGESDSGIDARFKSDFQSGRHFGGVNMAFADGHAKWLKTETVYNEAMKLMDEGLSYHPARSDNALEYPSAWNPWVSNSQ